jgi:hypothetical protein
MDPHESMLPQVSMHISNSKDTEFYPKQQGDMTMGDSREI